MRGVAALKFRVLPAGLRPYYRRDVDFLGILVQLPCPLAPTSPGEGLPDGLLEVLCGRPTRSGSSTGEDVGRLAGLFQNMAPFFSEGASIA